MVTSPTGQPSFAEQFFHKPLHKITEDDVQEFINYKHEENLNLEYKSIATLEKPGDIGKEISAFANSSGGLLIVGLGETKNGQNKIPSTIEWNYHKAYTKEWFA